MIVLVLILFILGYLTIVFEQPLRLNKAASALITGVLCWMIYFFHTSSPEKATGELLQHFGEISSVLFFLLGAMIIVEIMDAHHGFDIITEKITTRSKRTLLVIISVFTFFLSVMTSISSKLLKKKEDQWWFAGMIIIAANAGGVWSPLGDVTTSMLWIGGQVSASRLVLQTLFPALVVWIVPLLFIAGKFKGQKLEVTGEKTVSNREGVIILISGIILLVFVPVFKILTGMPPFMGMLLVLGLIWIITSFLHEKKLPENNDPKITPAEALQRIDAPSILFFLGILLAISALQSFGILKSAAEFLSTSCKNDYVIGIALGMVSAVVDNVPLVAAVQGMFDASVYPADHSFWEFIALTTGTGGSIIIIGSAAGVAVMGIRKISFGWYFKKISWIALLGFLAGIFVYIIQQKSFQ
ncbi:MAG: SLC13 family permease [Bacteroidetes bacterium]|nr:SLC13 family permease [Bacteroidota bacterium]